MAINRRDFLKGAGAATVAAPLLGTAAVAAQQEGAGNLDGGQPVELSLRINGQQQSLKVLPDTTLVEAVREGAGLCGSKVGCGHGACGACTMHLNGKPVTACLAFALDAAGQDVRTVEGVATGGTLHPVQQAFLDADALQCGYCTPGFVMSAVAFFDTWRAAHGKTRPPVDAVTHALAGNLCRCGAQPAIIAAAQAACAGETAVAPGAHHPGHAVALKRVDGQAKVTGAARYTVDVVLPGMLHAAVTRSPHAHAKVKSVDTSVASTMPGVKSVLVLLARGKKGYVTVRHAGQEIAAVAAETPAMARAAAAAVVVDYEVKTPAVDVTMAERPDAPLVFEAGDRGDAPRTAENPLIPPHWALTWNGNVRGGLRWPLSRPNPRPLAEAKASPIHVDLAFETQAQSHTALEPHCALASWDGKRLTLYTSTQSVKGVAEDLAEVLDLAPINIEVKSEYVGGGFGAKAGLKPEQVAAARLAMETRKPVRLVLSRAEELTVTGYRPGTRQHINLGAEKNGTFTAIHHEARTYCGIGVGEESTGLTNVHYVIPQVERVDFNVLTHAPYGLPFRAPGFPPNAFALEQAVDQVAAQMRVDPLMLRIHQERHPRKLAVYKLAHEASGAAARLAAVAPDKGRFVRGVGCGTAEWFVLANPTTVVQVRAWRDGHVQLSTATHDLGQGARTVLASMAHRMLGVPVEKIRVEVGSSALTNGPAAGGSVTTASIAPAAQHGLEDLQAALQRAGLRRSKGAVATPKGIRTADGRDVGFAALFEALPDDAFVTLGKRGPDRNGYQIPPAPLDKVLPDSALPFVLEKDVASSAQVTEVEVDRLLGRIKVLRVTTVIDAGTIMAPVTAHSQGMGAVIQGLSYALYEHRRVDVHTGRVLSRSLENYGILGIADAPRIDVHFLDLPSENSPHGGMGLGENSTVATAAAVANAFFHATGRRLLSTPMTPDKVLAALA